MSKFDLYKVDLKGMQQDTLQYEYLLDNQFFTNIDSEVIQKGKVNVSLTVTKTGGMYHLVFHLSGTIIIPCDRCLDDMDFPVETTAKLIVKLGKDYSEESDEIVVIPEKEGIINLAWFLYEFVALTIPIKHVHGPSNCNKQMTSKLKKHTAKSPDDMTDSRWDALKGLKD